MEYENYLQDAIELVNAWEIPEEEFARVVNDQARLMAGLGLEPSHDLSTPSPYAALRF